MLTREIRSFRRKTFPSDTLSADVTWTVLGVNRDFPGKKPVTNCLRLELWRHRLQLISHIAYYDGREGFYHVYGQTVWFYVFSCFFFLESGWV
jgi:hypothetical protein